MHRSQEEIKLSIKPREPYYVHTATWLHPVQPSTVSTAPRRSPSTTHQDINTASTLPAPLINPKHPPEVCPPSTSRWQKLKDENEQRKSREVTRISLDEAARRSGRDQRGFKTGEQDGWTEQEKDMEAKRVWQCVVM